jgi:hypothetical protein
MQINGIAKQLLNPLSLGQSSTTNTGGSTAATLDRLKKADGSPGGSEFHEILARYDVKSISPSDLGELAQSLHDAGEISDADLRDLNQLRSELEKDGIDPNQEIDLSAILEKKLAQSTSARDLLRSQTPAADPADIAAAEKSVGEKTRQAEWIRKFALVQQAGAAAIDTGA